MKKLTTLVLAITLFQIVSLAQDSSKINGGFYILSGPQYNDMKNLNRLLKQNNIPELPKFLSYYGFGGYFNSGSWVFGGEGYKYDASTSENNFEIKTKGEQGYLYFGYKIINGKKFYLLPKLGIGGGGVDVEINSKVESSLTGFLNTNNSNNLKTEGILLHSGLKFGFVFNSKLILNFDAGYNYGIATDWNAQYGNLTNSVKDGIGGLFLQFNLGYEF